MKNTPYQRCFPHFNLQVIETLQYQDHWTHCKGIQMPKNLRPLCNCILIIVQIYSHYYYNQRYQRRHAMRPDGHQRPKSINARKWPPSSFALMLVQVSSIITQKLINAGWCCCSLLKSFDDNYFSLNSIHQMTSLTSSSLHCTRLNVEVKTTTRFF